jgi:flavin-dependent dehydrogenase
VTWDVVIAGAGPAGAALAIDGSGRGLRVLLLDRRTAPPDKACGEGILPAGVRRLAALGVHLGPEHASPLAGIRYVQEDGSSVEGRFADGTGLGVRRTALSAALWERAAAAGAELRPGVEVQNVTREAGAIVAHTSAGPLRAHLVVAADGLHSRLRRAEGLELAPMRAAQHRFGVRRHLALAPWTDHVEVHWARGVEAYVTPAGSRRVGVAFLVHGAAARFDDLLQRFPALRDRLAGAPVDSEDRGAGPLLQNVQRRTAERLVLLGDAAGYVDAITGEGISLALACAADLAELLPDVLAAGAGPKSLAAYERRAAAHFAAYERVTRAVLLLSRFPALRRSLLGAGARLPAVFEKVLNVAVG